ncbi:hypothetical protein IAT38_007918 [Cryptococcus sp. DSM 104549]
MSFNWSHLGTHPSYWSRPTTATTPPTFYGHPSATRFSFSQQPVYTQPLNASAFSGGASNTGESNVNPVLLANLEHAVNIKAMLYDDAVDVLVEDDRQRRQARAESFHAAMTGASMSGMSGMTGGTMGMGTGLPPGVRVATVGGGTGAGTTATGTAQSSSAFWSKPYIVNQSTGATANPLQMYSDWLSAEETDAVTELKALDSSIAQVGNDVRNTRNATDFYLRKAREGVAELEERLRMNMTDELRRTISEFKSNLGSVGDTLGEERDAGRRLAGRYKSMGDTACKGWTLASERSKVDSGDVTWERANERTKKYCSDDPTSEATKAKRRPWELLAQSMGDSAPDESTVPTTAASGFTPVPTPTATGSGAPSQQSVYGFEPNLFQAGVNASYAGGMPSYGAWSGVYPGMASGRWW